MIIVKKIIKIINIKKNFVKLALKVIMLKLSSYKKIIIK